MRNMHLTKDQTLNFELDGGHDDDDKDDNWNDKNGDEWLKESVWHGDKEVNNY